MSKKKDQEGKADEVASVKSFKARKRMNEDVIETLERNHHIEGAKYMSEEEVLNLGYGEFVKWLKSMIRFGNIKRTILLFKISEDMVRAYFYTSEYEYNISAKLPNGDDKGYLGCTVQCRKSRVGECWTRGNDLLDGKYSEEKFNDIVRDIVSNEIKNLQCFVD